MAIDLQKLGEFLEKANENTYTSDGEEAASSRLQSKDFDFRDKDWIYHDTYFGNSKFIGEEIVYFQNQPVWGMNYYGYIVSKNDTPKKVYGFLKKALLQESGIMISVRGPMNFSEGEWEYKNIVEGDSNNFLGKEIILKNDQVMYECHYHVGLINL